MAFTFTNSPKETKRLSRNRNDENNGIVLDNKDKQDKQMRRYASRHAYQVRNRQKMQNERAYQ
jgi:hypothetical protein